MKKASLKLCLLVLLSYSTAAIGNNCYDIVESICGAGLLYPCSAYCATTPAQCAASAITERVSVRNSERCESSLGNTWVNCDDNEPKIKCTEERKCSTLSTTICPTT
jgi:hypothetical protein